MPPSKAVDTYEVSHYRVQPSSLDLPLVTSLGITERERRTTFIQLDQQSKVWATNTQQNWSTNVAINSRLLDMQGYKVQWAKDTATSSWSLIPIF
jgi:hypothetical protein